MREVKGSYLLWNTVGIYLLYLFMSYIGITPTHIVNGVLLVILGGIPCFTLYIIVYSQFYIPSVYQYDYNYERKRGNTDNFKNHYLNKYCGTKEAKWIKFSLYYWIVVIIEEINIFCNKYFTFKF